MTLNTNNNYNSTTGIFTAGNSGLYLIEATAFTDILAWSAGECIDMYIQKNSVGVKNVRASVHTVITNYLHVRNGSICALNAGDTIAAYFLNGRSGATAIYSSAAWSVLNIAEL